jgi:ribose 5-phosphate isomerase B
MKIYLGADHAGFKLKEEIKTFLRGFGYTIDDQGAFTLDPNDDYPDFMRLVARQVSSDPGSFGILFGGSGQGEAMLANRTRGIRATVFYGGPEEIINLSRVHNNANILSLGARFISPEQAKKVVKEWLSTDFPAEERHRRRILKIDGAAGDLPNF